MSDARGGHEMALADIVTQIRRQLHAGAAVDQGQLQRLLGDNRKSVDLQTQNEFRIGNLSPTAAEMRCSPIGKIFLPCV